jgi:hypothetical protein
VGLDDRFDSQNQPSLEAQSHRHDQRNERWLPRVHALEAVLAVGLPVAVAAAFGMPGLVWYLILASPFYVWGIVDWRRRKAE